MWSPVPGSVMLFSYVTSTRLALLRSITRQGFAGTSMYAGSTFLRAFASRYACTCLSRPISVFVLSFASARVSVRTLSVAVASCAATFTGHSSPAVIMLSKSNTLSLLQ